MLSITRNRGSIITAIGCLAVAACAGSRLVTPAPIPVPPADSTLIRDINADSLLLRMDEPGYVLVYRIGARGGWRRISPEYRRPVKLLAGPAVTVVFPRQHVWAHLPGAVSQPWPSEQMCSAQPQLCSNMSNWVVYTPERVPEYANRDATAGYVVIITPTLRVLDRIPPYLESTPQTRRPGEVPQWLVQRVAALVPVRRWAEYWIYR